MKTTKYTKQFAMLSIAAVYVAIAPMCAHADAAVVNVPTRTVHYSDLNLTTEAGVAVLYKRIRNAAEQVCGDVSSRRLNEAAVAKTCVDHAVYASVEAVNNAKLANAYNAQNGVEQKSINIASLR
jgi:UrcA family protein